jgi:hypothetical protein
MNQNRRVAEIGLARALILALGTASIARAGIAYLPLTGPPAMRVLAIRHQPPAPVGNTIPQVVIVNTNTLAAGTNACFDTNTEVYAVSSGGANTNLPAITIGSSNPLDTTSGTQVFAMPGQDLFNVTPEILATYFKPLNVGTNGLAIAGPYRVGFIPPFTQPDKSSHAEYIVK